jgi:hypothetical protein
MILAQPIRIRRPLIATWSPFIAVRSCFVPISLPDAKEPVRHHCYELNQLTSCEAAWAASQLARLSIR